MAYRLDNITVFGQYGEHLVYKSPNMRYLLHAGRRPKIQDRLESDRQLQLLLQAVVRRPDNAQRLRTHVFEELDRRDRAVREVPCVDTGEQVRTATVSRVERGALLF